MGPTRGFDMVPRNPGPHCGLSGTHICLTPRAISGLVRYAPDPAWKTRVGVGALVREHRARSGAHRNNRTGSEAADRGVRHAKGPGDSCQCLARLAPGNCLAMLIAVARLRPGLRLQRHAAGGGDHRHHGSEAIGCPCASAETFRSSGLLRCSVAAPSSPAAP